MTSWRKPTDEQIDRVALLSLRPQEEWHFFSRLENPLWIDAFYERKELEPPEPTVGQDEAVSVKPWPFSAYLARVAGDHPDHALVAEIIKQLADTENVFVRDDLTRALASLDPCSIGELLPRVATWVSERVLVLPMVDRTGELAVHALGCPGNDTAVKKLLLAQLKPPTVGPDRPHRAPTIDWWETKEFATRFIPRLVAQNWELTVGTFVDGLAETIGAQTGGLRSPTAGKYDFTDWWLRDTADEDESWETGEPLAFLAAQSLQAVARLHGVSPNAVLPLLDQGGWAVFVRLKLHYLACRARVGDVEASMLTALADLVRADYRPCREYDSLLKATFDRGAPETRESILKTLVSASADDGEQADYWLFGRLAVIAGDLPPDWTTRFKALVQRFGPPPKRGARVSVGYESTETRSPLEPNEAESMTAIELATYAREWTQPQEDFSFGQPTWKGLAADVESESKTRSIEFSRAASSFAGVERTVIRALFQGLKEAIQEGSSIDWEPTLQLMQRIAVEGEALDQNGAIWSGRDVSWSEAKREALELLQTGLGNEKSLPRNSATTVWQTIEALALNGGAAEYWSVDDVHDSVFVALNATKSRAAYAAVTFLLWLTRKAPAAPADEVRAFFERILDPDLEPFIGMRAAVAHRLPQLAYVNEAWLTRLLPRIFLSAETNPDHWSAAWDAYLRHSSPILPEAVLRDMMPFYRAAIEQIEPDHRTNGRRDRVVWLGMHLAAMFLRGDLELEHSELVDFFRRAPGPVRTRVYSWIGRIAGQDDLPESWFERAQQFAEWRERLVKEDELSAGELRMLGWLVASGGFPVDWWAPRLADALRLSGDSVGDYIPLEDLMRQVADASNSYPEMALEVLELVVEQDQHVQYRSYFDAANQITAAGMRDPKLVHRARRTADKLARVGIVDFERFSLSSN